MRLLGVDPSGVATLHHYDGVDHYFTVALTNLFAPTGLGADPNLLCTPLMTCTDVGCGYQCRSVLPLTGDENAQRIHAHYRLAAGAQPSYVPAAVDSVRADVAAHGGRVLLPTTG